MKKIKNNIILVSSFIIIISILITYYYQQNEKIINDTKLYIKEIYRVERNFIESLPLFNDYTTPEKEKKLRKYLLRAHLRVAKKYGVAPVKDDNDTQMYTSNGELVKLESDPEKLYYFYNVREHYRYITPMASNGLDFITERFQENLSAKGNQHIVKVAISSLLRPVKYQRGLTARNINASIESTHSYGASFDIYFDDYYVSLPEPVTENAAAREIQENIRRRFGFLIGDALRSQFHSVLMETLIQLQDEGLLYAILERKQRCYHVTIIK